MKIILIISALIVFTSCASKVNINEAQEKVKIVQELPKDKKCISVGEVEVKDILESSAIEELKNMSHGLGGNYLIIKETKYKTAFVIHKAQVFSCK